VTYSVQADHQQHVIYALHSLHIYQATWAFHPYPTPRCPFLPSPIPSCYKWSVHPPHTVFHAASTLESFLCNIRFHVPHRTLGADADLGRFQRRTVSRNVGWVHAVDGQHAHRRDDRQKGYHV
jgi:hypothetical protein